MNLYDKNGIAIQPFDLLKVYHFTGSRRKKYYMYKHVTGDASFNKNYFVLSSLSKCGHTYHELKDNSVLLDYEIIQGSNQEERGIK